MCKYTLSRRSKHSKLWYTKLFFKVELWVNQFHKFFSNLILFYCWLLPFSAVSPGFKKWLPETELILYIRDHSAIRKWSLSSFYSWSGILPMILFSIFNTGSMFTFMIIYSKGICIHRQNPLCKREKFPRIQ